MAKREFVHTNEMHKYVGKEIGDSDCVEVSQDRINQFAEATGDHQWIHVDVERAKKDMPGGKTIAHGFLTLSLIPMLNHQISHINNVRNGINYGCNKVRFTSPVPAGSKVRARAKLASPRPCPSATAPEGVGFLLKREELTSERIEEIVSDARKAGYHFFLSAEEREASLKEAMTRYQPGDDAWGAAYGSLMWMPPLECA